MKRWHHCLYANMYKTLHISELIGFQSVLANSKHQGLAEFIANSPLNYFSEIAPGTSLKTRLFIFDYYN